MPTQLIEFKNGILVEAEISENLDQPISSKYTKKVCQTFDSIRTILVEISQPIAESLTEIKDKFEIESAEVELNFNFEGEGNIYITKAKAGAALSVKLVLKPKK